MNAREQCQMVSSWIDSQSEVDWNAVRAAMSQLEDQELVARLKSIAETTTDLRSPAVLESNAPATINPQFSKGDRLENRYRIETFLDRGGMGEVYRATDTLLDVTVALKVIRAEVSSDPVALNRFKQELLLARSVSHPNVCRIYHLGWDDKRSVAFLTMEFLAGQTLQSRIQAHGRMDPEDARPIIRQVAAGLEAAHRAGIVHRDFKSANVMLVPNGSGCRAVIMDFGLAIPMEPTSGWCDASELSTGRVEPTGHIVGTPAYMSPEQVTDGALSAASDLYALGVVIFEMVTAQLPFRCGTPLEMALAHVDATPTSPTEYTDLSPRWENVILQLLAKAPGDRFSSAGEVVVVLDGDDTEVDTVRGNLPPERDAFIGRKREISTLAALMDSELGQSGTEGNPGSRLVTVQGPGGIGKTRLALHYARESQIRWPGGVWFCDLTEARTINGIVHAVASALDVPLDQQDPVVKLGHAMAGRPRSLIILDNFEHVVEHAQATIGHWLDRAHEASFLVTSRERLRLHQESVHVLEPLDPTTHGVELFAARAATHRPGFTMDDRTRSQVEVISEQLDGLPLAIELAASRLRILSVEQLQARLADRFELLTGGTRGRHETLATTLSWSWELLEPWEQLAAVQAATFEGGFTLEAAEEIIVLSSFDESPPVLDALQSLIDKSWVRTGAARGNELRFSMLESIRSYLVSSCDTTTAKQAEARHGAYYSRLGSSETLDLLRKPGGAGLRAALAAELDNLVSACRRATARGDEEVAARCYFAADQVLAGQGPYRASIEIGEALANNVRSPALLGRVLDLLGDATKAGGDFKKAEDHYRSALGLHRRTGDRLNEGRTLGRLGSLHGHLGKAEEAMEELEEALRLHRELDDAAWIGTSLGHLGGLYRYLGRPQDALATYEKSLETFRTLRDELSEATTLDLLGGLNRDLGVLDQSEEYLNEALAMYRRLGDRGREGIALSGLASIAIARFQIDRALELFESALNIHREVGSRQFEGSVLGLIGTAHKIQDRPVEAHRHFTAALEIVEEVGDVISQGYWLGALGELELHEERIADARSYTERSLEVFRKVGYRTFEGSMLGQLGRVHEASGEMNEARECFESALVILKEAGDGRSAAQWMETLGALQMKQGQIDEAAESYREAIEILRSIGNSPQLVGVLCGLAELELQRHDSQAAAEALTDAESVFRDLQVSEGKLTSRLDDLRKALTG